MTAFNKKRNVLLLVVALSGTAVGTFAQGRPVDGKVESGEAGYIIGCSAAASLGISACGELPSGRPSPTPQPSASPSPTK
jgi:hypothetical protein